MNNYEIIGLMLHEMFALFFIVTGGIVVTMFIIRARVKTWEDLRYFIGFLLFLSFGLWQQFIIYTHIYG